jgi:hypothetical protein
MLRSMFTAALCAAAVFVGDLAFRRSLLQEVRPIIVTPMDQSVTTPPVRVQWEGPPAMHVRLSLAGAEVVDLGIQQSPLVIGPEHFPRDGGYEVEIVSPTFGDWVSAERRFQVHTHTPPAESVAEESPPSEPSSEVHDLRQALEAARIERDKEADRARLLREELTGVREENQRLSRQLDAEADSAEDEVDQQRAELERRLTQALDDNRLLADDNAALRQRLASVNPCSVWGYYALLRSQTATAGRRMLVVSDPRGQIFRVQVECEAVRQADPGALSVCLCIGTPWGG